MNGTRSAGTGRADSAIRPKLCFRDRRFDGVSFIADVRGKLVDRAGRPVAGVRLKVTGLGSKVNGFVTDPRPLSEAALLMETVSDAKGEYSLSLPDAAYCEVKVATPRYMAKKLMIPTGRRFCGSGIRDPLRSGADR